MHLISLFADRLFLNTTLPIASHCMGLVSFPWIQARCHINLKRKPFIMLSRLLVCPILELVMNFMVYLAEILLYHFTPEGIKWWWLKKKTCLVEDKLLAENDDGLLSVSRRKLRVLAIDLRAAKCFLVYVGKSLVRDRAWVIGIFTGIWRLSLQNYSGGN